jgi:hypothetical protein
MYRMRDRQMDYYWMDRQINAGIERLVDRQADRQVERRTDRLTKRQIERQMHF